MARLAFALLKRPGTRLSVPLRAAVEQVVGVAFERFAEIGMSDRHHAPRALLERLPAQFGRAELGHDDVGV